MATANTNGAESAAPEKKPFDQAEYNEQWQRENYRRVVVKLNKVSDFDILRHLEAQDSVNAYIKALIRLDIVRREDAKRQRREARAAAQEAKSE